MASNEEQGKNAHWQDWPGLLKWSMQYQDGTNPSPELKEMSAERKEWLSEALSQVHGETDLMIDHFKVVVENPDKYFEEGMSEEELEKRMFSLEGVRDYVDNLDNAKDLININAFQPLIELIGCCYEKVQEIAADIVGVAVQNHPECQKFASEHRAVQTLVDNYKRSKSAAVRVSCMGAISSLVRGLSPALPTFLSYEGLPFCFDVLDNWKENSSRLNVKCLFLLSSLVNESPKATGPLIEERVCAAVVALVEGAAEEWNVRERALMFASALCSASPPAGMGSWAGVFREGGLLPLLLSLRKEITSMPEEEQDCLYDVVECLNSLSRVVMMAPAAVSR